MPIYGLECGECGEKWDTILKSKDDLADAFCPKCNSVELQLQLSFPGTYQIKGDNGASTRPRRMGGKK